MFTPAAGVYIMNKEQKVDLFGQFEDMKEKAILLMNLTLTLGVCAVNYVLYNIGEINYIY